MSWAHIILKDVYFKLVATQAFCDVLIVSVWIIDVILPHLARLSKCGEFVTIYLYLQHTVTKVSFETQDNINHSTIHHHNQSTMTSHVWTCDPCREIHRYTTTWQIAVQISTNIPAIARTATSRVEIHRILINFTLVSSVFDTFDTVFLCWFSASIFLQWT